MRTFIFLLLSGLALTVSAADQDGNYAVWGPGQKSCYNYSNARTAGEHGDYKYFIMGYLTAYNTLSEKTYRISGNKNLKEILKWMDGYCDENGVHSFEQAIANFIVEHHDTRYSQPASRFWR